MPIIGGARLYAAEDSRAELEFEDGSSVRMVGPAQISLVELAASESGNPVNVVEVDSGVVYFNARMRNQDEFRIVTPTGESFAITQPTRMHIKVDEQVATLTVTEGRVAVQNSVTAGNVEIQSGQTYNYLLGQPESMVLQLNAPTQTEDSWNQQRQAQDDQNLAAADSGTGNVDQAELGSYGTYSDLPGYGVSWQPNGVGPDWDPFGYGAWSYYPDWGWTYISAYPWGWAPYYYGNWFYVGGSGWWWRPGHGPHHPWAPGQPGGWHPQPRYTSTPARFSAPKPPASASHGTVAIAGSNLRVGSITATHTSTIARNTVGSGIPTGGPLGRVGENSNLVRGHAVPATPGSVVVGQKGSYALASGVTTTHNGYEVHRPSAGYSAAPQRTYNYAGTTAPRTSSAPPASVQHSSGSSAPHASSGGGASHVSSGGGGGGGFHGGGGGGGGGGFHGGGGGGGGHR
jgi:hypothetical protein